MSKPAPSPKHSQPPPASQSNLPASQVSQSNLPASRSHSDLLASGHSQSVLHTSQNDLPASRPSQSALPAAAAFPKIAPPTATNTKETTTASASQPTPGKFSLPQPDAGARLAPPPKQNGTNLRQSATNLRQSATNLRQTSPGGKLTTTTSLAHKALRLSSWTPMREKMGKFWGWIAKKLFRDISISPERLEKLQAADQEGTIVYVARSQSYLNYLIYNDLFIRKELPLARLGYGLYWLPWLPFTSQLRAVAGWLGRLFGQGGKDVAELFREMVRHDQATLFFLRRPVTWYAHLRHGFYWIRDKLRALFGLPPAPGGRQVDLIEELLILQRQQERPIFLCPQIMIWARTPTSSRSSFFDLIFGEKEFPGILRESYLFLRERRTSWVRGGAPINLKTLLNKHSDLNDAQLAETVRELLNHRLDREYRVVTGPPRRPLEETHQLVLQAPHVQKEIAALCDKEGITHEAAQQRALKMIQRLAADPRLSTARWLDFFLRTIWRRMYNRIGVDERGLESLREASIKGPIVLLPNHQSHIDYLILSQVMYHYDMELPYIASGDNLLLPVIGWIFRRSGAFFIRRSFGDDTLYRSVFREYIHHLVREDHTIEFFIEGGRSRNGKLRNPKMGLLADIVDAYLSGQVPEIHFAPISIDYEKIIEGESYSNEQLGADKVKESFRNILRARRVLKLNFGSIDISFAQPISLKNFVAQQILEEQAGQHPGYDPYHNEEDRKHLVRALGYHIVYDINNVSTITPTALVSAALLTHPRRGISHDELIEKVRWISEEILQRGGQIAPFGTFEDLIEHTMVSLKGLIKRPKDLLEPVYRPRNNRWIELGYYRNQLIHLFTLDGMVACALAAFRQHRNNDKGIHQDKLLEQVRFVSQLLKLEFIYKPSPDIQANFSQSINHMEQRGVLQIQDQYVKLTHPRDEMIRFLRALFGPYLDSYWVASLSLFELMPEERIEEKTFLRHMQRTAETLYHEGFLRYSEIVSKETLKNALLLFQDLDIIQKQKEAKPAGRRSSSFIQLQAHFREPTVLQAFVERIGQFSSCERCHETTRRFIAMQTKDKKDDA